MSVKEFGNAAAMHDALVWLRKTGHRSPEGGWMCITLKMTQKDGKPYPIEVPPYAEDVINAALSAPPRNCDVGTAEEQEERFNKFCDAHSCNECPARGGWRTVYIDGTSFRMIQCGVLWAQLPYKLEMGEKEGGAE